jgi:dUTP pyrophosphatase
MEVKIKKLHADAVIPKYAKSGDAGLDLTAISRSRDGQVVTYGTGLAVEIPEGYVGLIFPRSSIFKTTMSLSNSVGVIDSGYRGEVMLKFVDRCESVIGRETYKVGDRVGQLLIIPYPSIELVEVEELSSSERGAGGYGSSGV